MIVVRIACPNADDTVKTVVQALFCVALVIALAVVEYLPAEHPAPGFCTVLPGLRLVFTVFRVVITVRDVAFRLEERKEEVFINNQIGSKKNCCNFHKQTCLKFFGTKAHLSVFSKLISDTWKIAMS